LLSITFMSALSYGTTNSGSQIFNSVGEYNQEQIARAKRFWIPDEQQSGPTCVCHTMNNLNAALTGVKKPLSAEALSACKNQIFSDRYSKFMKSTPGELFGGTSVLHGSNLTSGKIAINKIIDAIDDGKVAAVSLNAEAIYDEYSGKYVHEPFQKIKGIPHAVIVIGIQRNKYGEVTKFILADSSGPKRRYMVSNTAFEKSYSSLRAQFSRGVFIPAKSIYSAIKYEPHS